MLELRRATKQDISGVMELLRQVNLVHHRGRPDLFNPTAKYTPQALSEIFADDATPVFLCVEEGKLLGHAFCVHKQEPPGGLLTAVKTLYIDDICVDEGARGKGVGTALYQHVLAYARSHGCYHVTLNVWAFNSSALEFYRAMGMKPLKIGMETIL